MHPLLAQGSGGDIAALPGEYVLYAMAAVLPLALAWYVLLTLWKRLRGNGRAPQAFSIRTGWMALTGALLLQFLMTPQTLLPSPDREFIAEYWLVCLLLFTYALPALWVGQLLFGISSGTRPNRVKVCERCGNREHLHTEYCVRCGHRFIPRRPAAEIPPAL